MPIFFIRKPRIFIIIIYLASYRCAVFEQMTSKNLPARVQFDFGTSIKTKSKP